IGLNNSHHLATLDGASLDLVGQVADLGAALASARIMVVPTRFAAGVPHKVHQAAMLGIPMVVTKLIGEQVGWTAGEDLLVAADATEFAASCARLYRDKASWQSIREGALERA